MDQDRDIGGIKRNAMGDMTTMVVDCHHHIYDPNWPVDPRAVLAAPRKGIQDYEQTKARLGISHSVVIQPSTYGYDNAGLVDAIERLGRDCARGVAVTPVDASAADLAALADAGVVALRVNMQLNQAISAAADVPRLAARCADRGWHLEINAPAALIAQHAKLWCDLPCHLVLDHIANLPAASYPDDVARRAVANLIDRGHTWVKLSGPYFGCSQRPYLLSSSEALIRWFVERCAHRLVWGSNWPHPTEPRCHPPDELSFMNTLRDEWITHLEDRDRIFFRNAMQLYQFSAPI